ncbi:MAG TPA: hypothetical protein VMU83_20515 [Hanamia sp.]|nr:hypothetical protein [Hanamia sp.]
MNRKDKIILLKGIQSGAIPIDTIQPRLFRVEGHTIPNGGGSKCFINNKEVDPDNYKKEVVKNQKGDEVEIIIDGMELDEWVDFVNHKK